MSPPYRRNEASVQWGVSARPNMGLSNRLEKGRRPRAVPSESTQPSTENPAHFIPNNFEGSTNWSSYSRSERSSYLVTPPTFTTFDHGVYQYPMPDDDANPYACGYHYLQNGHSDAHYDPWRMSSEHSSPPYTYNSSVGFDHRYSPGSRSGRTFAENVYPTCRTCQNTGGYTKMTLLLSTSDDQRCERCKLLLEGVRKLTNVFGPLGSGLLRLFTQASHLRFAKDSSLGHPFEFSVQGFWPERQNPRFQYLAGSDAIPFATPDSSRLLEDVVQELDVDRVVVMVRKWMSSCDTFHTQCNPRISGRLPKRVVDIPPEDTGPIKLLEPQSGINADYIALSYCWGSSGTRFQTTLATLTAYLQEIPQSHFPRLFLDVISICRALGIRYLWIDALCIIQDSIEDWELQASEMASIYSNSYLTIAATGCSDPSAPLFFERWTESVLNEQRFRMGVGSTSIQSSRGTVKIRPSLHLAHARFTKVDNAQQHTADAPLLTRAWTYQERLLPTHTLHFHAEELVWECKSGVRCECGHLDDQELKDAEIHSLAISCKPKPDRWLKSFVAQATQPDMKLTDLCDIWMDLISEYSGLNLTYEKDRLPALSGLAVKFSNKALGGYIAGMWIKALPALLLWKVCSESDKPVRQYDDVSHSAPSWSWASVCLSPGIAVSYTRVINFASAVLDKLEILNVRADAIGHNPYGWVKNAVLEVRGRTLKCVAVQVPGDEIVLRRNDLELPVEEGPSAQHDIMELLMDYQGLYEHGKEVMILSIGSRFGIALEEVESPESEPPVYRRIGLVVWKEDKETWSLRRNNQARLKMRQLSII